MTTPSFEDVFLATLVGRFTKVAFDMDSVKAMLSDPRVAGALAGTGVGGTIGALAGRSRGRSGIADALRSGLIGGASGAAIGAGVQQEAVGQMYPPRFPERIEHDNNAALLGRLGFGVGGGGLIGQMFDKPGYGAALGGAIGLSRGMNDQKSYVTPPRELPPVPNPPMGNYRVT